LLCLTSVVSRPIDHHDQMLNNVNVEIQKKKLKTRRQLLVLKQSNRMVRGYQDTHIIANLCGAYHTLVMLKNARKIAKVHAMYVN
jgi:hypothetical protein